MHIDDCRLALLSCRGYDDCRPAVANLFACLRPENWHGRTVLVKPNLVVGRRPNDPACTNPAMIRAVCEQLLDLGARVMIGDSPAFGSASQVLRKIGATEALAGLPVRFVEFNAAVTVLTSSGLAVGIAKAALECDLLLNLPKLKAHGQLLITLAVKNLFGVVAGLRKPWLHLRLGDDGNRFASLIVDLIQLLPEGLSIVDGIVAMHRTGPADGEHLPLGLLAGAVNPVAADTGILSLLGIDHVRSPIWRECARRGLAGSEKKDIIHPLSTPADISLPPFSVPDILAPIRFQPLHIVGSIGKRLTPKYLR